MALDQSMTRQRTALPARAGTLFWRRVVRDPIDAGRLRDVGWPHGLRAIVGSAVLVYLIGALLVVFSPLIRRGLELSVAPDLGPAVPRGIVWLLLFMIMFTLALFQAATLRGPWWFRALGLVISIGLLAIWGILGAQNLGSPLLLGVVLAPLLCLVLLLVVRGRRPFAWWEPPLILLLDAVVVSVALTGFGIGSRPLGFDFAPVLLQQTITVLGQLAIPISLAAGVALAEITVRATVWATRLVGRLLPTDPAGRSAGGSAPAAGWPRRNAAYLLLRRNAAYLLLAVLLVLRLGQGVFEFASLDPITQGWRARLVTAGYAVVMALVGLAVFRLSRRRAAAVAASELPETLGRIAFPIGVAMTGLLLPVSIGLLGLQAVISLDPTGTFAGMAFDPVGLFGSTAAVGVARLLLALILLVLAVRQARRGGTGIALLFALVAVMLLPVPLTWFTGGRVAITPDSDLLNLLATLVVVVALGWFAIRGSLTRIRAVGLGGLLILSGLFSYRDFISDPLGALLGFSGAALVMFGLTWGLLTECDFANHDGRRFQVPTRVMLALANFVLAITIVAYGALVRDPGAALNLDKIADLGDFVLGTALLVSAFVCVLAATAADTEVG
ncbi:hypothetical protein GCM10009841_28440 [Microlunatus panaciterrae]|uniref:Membrane protein involved in the export of O-antigen and teichoic acid n=1 Tax=Microlunatus panaciterrae TaxID=400768 RepID=A0ABS2RER9_9ACTN|nr:hypothetical protein [Microlunatus panaciterrae]MBM7797504.1 hypothetical protein [Microlunatus panaciterrae]